MREGLRKVKQTAALLTGIMIPAGVAQPVSRATQSTTAADASALHHSIAGRS